MNIAVTGLAGYEGSRIIYNDVNLRGKILKRYPAEFFDIFGEPEMREAKYPGDISGYEGFYADGADGGVLAALWRVLKAVRSGGYYSLRAIPVLQQTIEISELFGLNPYRLHAPGLRVWLTDDESPVSFGELKTMGLPFALIGHTCGQTAIRRTDIDADSSLRRPGPDELIRLLGPQK